MFWLYCAWLRCFLYFKFGTTTELNLTFEAAPVLLPCNCQVKFIWVWHVSTLRAEGTIFCCVSWRAKSSLCRQLFKSVQKSGQIKWKNGFFPVLDQFRALRESCVANQSCHSYLFPRNLHHFTTNLKINFAHESCEEFRACTIGNWTVVCRRYFSHSNTAVERRLELALPWSQTFSLSFLLNKWKWSCKAAREIRENLQGLLYQSSLWFEVYLREEVVQKKISPDLRFAV